VPVRIERRYTRSDPRGRFPGITGAPDIDANRVALYWRPLLDLAGSRLAPMRLAMMAPVTGWLATGEPGRVCWFSRIGVVGLRDQVLRHAGLDGYQAHRPQDLPAELRSDGWQVLVDALDGFDGLDPYLRALVVFQLAQLTMGQYAARLTGVVAPRDEPGHDHYAYQAARAYSRAPGRSGPAMPVFEVLAAAQGVGQAVRNLGDAALAARFEELGRRVAPVPGSWHDHLARSRFHRAVALLRIVRRQPAGMRDELEEAWRQHREAAALAPDDEVSRSVVVENRRIIIESEIKSKHRVDEPDVPDQLRAWARELAGIDPYCVEARLVVGDAYLAAGDVADAARWYARAGELGTSAGANGWYRAGQCHHHLGDRDAALTAMGRCLELDTTAVEPRAYLEEHGSPVPDRLAAGQPA
jgi:tetratricopeptide (TPR) repeat protein